MGSIFRSRSGQGEFDGPYIGSSYAGYPQSRRGRFKLDRVVPVILMLLGVVFLAIF